MRFTKPKAGRGCAGVVRLETRGERVLGTGTRSQAALTKLQPSFAIVSLCVRGCECLRMSACVCACMRVCLLIAPRPSRRRVPADKRAAGFIVACHHRSSCAPTQASDGVSSNRRFAASSGAPPAASMLRLGRCAAIVADSAMSACCMAVARCASSHCVPAVDARICQCRERGWSSAVAVSKLATSTASRRAGEKLQLESRAGRSVAQSRAGRSVAQGRGDTRVGRSGKGVRGGEDYQSGAREKTIKVHLVPAAAAPPAAAAAAAGCKGRGRSPCSSVRVPRALAGSPARYKCYWSAFRRLRSRQHISRILEPDRCSAARRRSGVQPGEEQGALFRCIAPFPALLPGAALRCKGPITRGTLLSSHSSSRRCLLS